MNGSSELIWRRLRMPAMRGVDASERAVSQWAVCALVACSFFRLSVVAAVNVCRASGEGMAGAVVGSGCVEAVAACVLCAER